MGDILSRLHFLDWAINKAACSERRRPRIHSKNNRSPSPVGKNRKQPAGLRNLAMRRKKRAEENQHWDVWARIGAIKGRKGLGCSAPGRTYAQTMYPLMQPTTLRMNARRGESKHCPSKIMRKDVNQDPDRSLRHFWASKSLDPRNFVLFRAVDAGILRL